MVQRPGRSRKFDRRGACHFVPSLGLTPAPHRPGGGHSGSRVQLLAGGALVRLRGFASGERRWRAALTVVLALYGWWCLRAPNTYRWIDSLDLAIHEAGHLLFAFGGELSTLLGGTVLQLLIPLIFVIALWRQGDRHGASVPLWWLGQNCWNVSVYIKDARTQELPLVGGGEHDWALILGRFGWLPRDQAIGGAVYLAGLLIFLTSLALGWRALANRGDSSSTTGETAA